MMFGWSLAVQLFEWGRGSVTPGTAEACFSLKCRVLPGEGFNVALQTCELKNNKIWVSFLFQIFGYLQTARGEARFSTKL